MYPTSTQRHELRVRNSRTEDVAACRDPRCCWSQNWQPSATASVGTALKSGTTKHAFFLVLIRRRKCAHPGKTPHSWEVQLRGKHLKNPWQPLQWADGEITVTGSRCPRHEAWRTRTCKQATVLSLLLMAA